MFFCMMKPVTFLTLAAVASLAPLLFITQPLFSMKNRFPVPPTLFAALAGLMAFALVGCYEDTTELTLNADGSGQLEREIVISDRFLVAMTEQEEDAGSGQMSMNNELPFDRESFMKIVDEEVFTLETFETTDEDNGNRRISITGSFDDATAFLNSELGEQTMVKLVADGEGNAALHWTAFNSDQFENDLGWPQMYGLAKGLRMATVVNAPAPLTHEHGEGEGEGNTARWEIDLTSREALEKTIALENALEGGNAVATFEGNPFELELPAAETPAPGGPSVEVAAESTAEGEEGEEGEGGARGLSATVGSVTITRTAEVAELPDDVSSRGLPEPRAALGIHLTWPEGKRPISFEEPEVTEATDDTGQSLVDPDHSFSTFRTDVWEHEESLLIAAENMVAPGEGASEIVSLEGVVPVLMGTETEEIQVTELQANEGQPITGSEMAEQLAVAIKKIQGSQVDVSTNSESLETAFLVKGGAEGERLETQGKGWSGFNDEYTYNFTFPQPVEEGDALVLVVVTKEIIARVPFSASELPLP
jgi:hypothetical protein